MNRSTYGPETITQSLNRVQSEASILFSLPIYSDHSSCCQFRPRATFRHSCPYGPQAATHACPRTHTGARTSTRLEDDLAASPICPAHGRRPRTRAVDPARMRASGCRARLACVPASNGQPGMATQPPQKVSVHTLRALCL